MTGKGGPTVTIVMATFNGAAHLPAQLASIAAQSHRDWQLWVSDDGSQDDTRTILADFARRHPMRLIEGPRAGAAANFLSALCHPDLPEGPVALADQDDVWFRGKLARALRRIYRAPGSGPLLYAAESVLTDADLVPLRVSAEPRARPGFANALVQNLFAGHSMVLNPAALALVRRAGDPVGVAFHDWWIYQLVAGAGGRLLLDPLPTVRYRQHGANALGGAGGLAAAGKRLTMILKRDFAAKIEAHAAALTEVSDLLTPEARRTLAAFRAAPRGGPGRIAALRQLGIARASRSGQAAFLAAALLGRL